MEERTISDGVGEIDAGARESSGFVPWRQQEQKRRRLRILSTMKAAPCDQGEDLFVYGLSLRKLLFR